MSGGGPPPPLTTRANRHRAAINLGMSAGGAASSGPARTRGRRKWSGAVGTAATVATAPEGIPGFSSLALALPATDEGQPGDTRAKEQ